MVFFLLLDAILDYHDKGFESLLESLEFDVREVVKEEFVELDFGEVLFL